jgi:hypothetical protein
VAPGDFQGPVQALGVDLARGLLELALDEAAKQLGLDDAQLQVLGAAPEGLVGVVEDPLHHVALAAQIDVGHIRLSLEDGA